MDVAKNVLYISYDGMTDPLGQSQVLPYIIGLSKKGLRFHLISCEKPDRFEQEKAVIEKICAKHQITWHPVPYTKSPPVVSTVKDIYHIRKKALQIHQEVGLDIVHCRSYPSSLVGLELKKKFGIKFIFDMRGFWADERVDGDMWNLSNPIFKVIYKYFKGKEAEFITHADGIVSLTEIGRKEMQTWESVKKNSKQIDVIPCAADFDHFTVVNDEKRQVAKQRLGLSDATKVITYLGSIGGWYMLDEMLDFYQAFQQKIPDSKFFFITPMQPEEILKEVRKRGMEESRFIFKYAQRSEVPQFLAASDYGLFFIKPLYSKKSSSPTKLGEYFAQGIPVITNANVGDVKEIVALTEGGVAIDNFDEKSYEIALNQLLDTKFAPEKIRQKAQNYYDLERAIERYYAIYRKLM